MIDIVKELRDALAENTTTAPEIEALIARADAAIEQTRVIEVPGAEVYGTSDGHGAPLTFLRRKVGDDTEAWWSPVLGEGLFDDTTETDALAGLSDGPCTVTVLVRVGGER